MKKYWIINGIGHVIHCNFKTRREAKEWLERYSKKQIREYKLKVRKQPKEYPTIMHDERGINNEI